MRNYYSTFKNILGKLPCLEFHLSECNSIWYVRLLFGHFQCGALQLPKLVNITPIRLGFMVDIPILNGGYKPTYNWRDLWGHHFVKTHFFAGFGALLSSASVFWTTERDVVAHNGSMVIGTSVLEFQRFGISAVAIWKQFWNIRCCFGCTWATSLKVTQRRSREVNSLEGNSMRQLQSQGSTGATGIVTFFRAGNGSQLHGGPERAQLGSFRGPLGGNPARCRGRVIFGPGNHSNHSFWIIFGSKLRQSLPILRPISIY